MESVQYTKYRIYSDFVHNDYFDTTKYFIPRLKLSFHINPSTTDYPGIMVDKTDILLPCSGNPLDDDPVFMDEIHEMTLPDTFIDEVTKIYQLKVNYENARDKLTKYFSLLTNNKLK